MGSSKMRALVAERNQDRVGIIGIFEVPSSGLRKGRVVDFNDVVQSMGKLLGEVRSVSKLALKNIILGISSVDFKVHRSRGSVPVSRADLEIREDDVERVIQAARALNVPHNRMLVHAITREFVVDGVGDIADPIGMMGGKLEVDSLIIDLFSPSVKTLIKSIEMAGAPHSPHHMKRTYGMLLVA